MKLALVIAVGLFGCSHHRSELGSNDRPTALGKERADCRPDKTCDPNLMCLSNLCVRPPGADCQLVADELASLDLGNYAEPEQRAPVVAKFKSVCETQYVTKEEGTCLDKAHDRWAASQCVARLFPELTAPGTECAQVAEKTRSSVARQYAGYSDPTYKRYIDAMVEAVRQSCKEDKWSAVVTKCVLAQEPDQNVFSYQTCTQQMGPETMQKLQERYAKLMQQAQAQQ